MIVNNQCEKCNHYYVCKKLSVLEKFDSDSKKYIGVDITMNDCKDFECESISQVNGDDDPEE